MNPEVMGFHDAATFTFTYVVYDRDGGAAAIVDPVLDYEPSTARTSTTSADRVLDFVRQHRLTVEWILETHAHADHLTAAAYLKAATGAKVAIGKGITDVQAHFKTLFGLEPEFATDGSQFDRLFADGDSFRIGDLEARAISTPGHTGDSLTYLVGDAAFVGDTLFAPETGTARTDFPGGDARALYRSIRRLFDLPADTRLFLCHDYPPDGREPHPQSSLDEQKRSNVHVGGGSGEEAFVRTRSERDATLAAPKLILPALQVNIRAGELPPRDANGIRYLRLPLDQLGENGVTAAWMLALAGGVLIGLSATLLLWLDGRVAGVSGIANGILFPKAGDVAWRAAFLGGLVVFGGLYMALVPGAPQPRGDFSRAGLLLAGLLVGFGTRMGNGCTSGHGVCGLGRLSVRSFAAVLTFMATAVATTFVVRHLWS